MTPAVSLCEAKQSGRGNLTLDNLLHRQTFQIVKGLIRTNKEVFQRRLIYVVLWTP